MSSARSLEEKELISAVRYSNDLGKVTELLSAGCSANVCENDGTAAPVLHLARSAQVAEVLLSHGAWVNGTNSYREPPLHSAITIRGGYEVVKVLLKHGADVNYSNRKGNTALTLAVRKRTCCSRTVKELLKYGADIYRANREHGCTPLDYSVNKLDRYKLVVKYSLLYRFKKYSDKKINLTPYKDHRNYSELVCYYEKCVDEVVKMKSDVAFGSTSVYEFVTLDYNFTSLYPENEITNKDLPALYPVYHDDIEEKLSKCLKRGELLKTVRERAIYTVYSNGGNSGEKITLDCDTITVIAMYLPNDDISNLITAFQVSEKSDDSHMNDSTIAVVDSRCVYNKHSIDEGSEDSSKRVKLEHGLAEGEISVDPSNSML